MLSFGLTGALAAILFLALPSSSPIWFFSAILAAIANIGFGVSFVAMNSYLPSLAQTSPEVIMLKEELDQDAATSTSFDEDIDEGAALDQDEPLLDHRREESAELRARYDSALSRATSRISSLGIALGYGAGILMLILALIPVTKLGGTTFSLRLAIGLSGVWWAVFTIPAGILLPGAKSMEGGEQYEVVKKEWRVGREIVNAWRRLGGMLHPREIAALRNTFKYLAAWFLLSDGGLLSSAPWSCNLTVFQDLRL